MKNGYHPEKNRGSPKKTLKEQGFYHSSAWRRVRRQALERDHYLCQECLRQKKTIPKTATEVHHIRPLEEYPELALSLDNLESLCWDCHERTKHRRRKEKIAGVRVIRISDGSEE